MPRSNDRAAALVPALLLVLTALVCVAVYYSDEGETFARSSFLRFSFGDPVHEPQTFIGHSLWLAAEFAFLLSLLGVLATTAILARRTSPPAARTFLTWSPLLLVGVSLVAAQIAPSAPLTPAYTNEFITRMADVDARAGWLLSFHSALLAASLILAATCCGLLLAGASKLDATAVRKRQYALRVLCYVLAGCLVFGVAQVYAFHLIPLRILSAENQRLLQEAAAIIAVLNGVLLSALLLSLFIPTIAILRFHANRLADLHNGDDPSKRVEWLKQQGLDSSWRVDLTSFVTMLSPALTSFLGYFLSLTPS